MHNAPTGKVVLVILATADSSPVMSRTLGWLRRRWPRCPVTVVGSEGGGEREIAARKGGASFLARPVTTDQWSALLSHALGEQQPARAQRTASEAEFGRDYTANGDSKKSDGLTEEPSVRTVAAPGDMPNG